MPWTSKTQPSPRKISGSALVKAHEMTPSPTLIYSCMNYNKQYF